jgi:hypothetical protein
MRAACPAQLSLFIGTTLYKCVCVGGVGVKLHVFVISEVAEGECSALPARCFPGKEPRYPLDKNLDGSQCRAGCDGEVKKLHISAGNRTAVLRFVSCHFTDLPFRLVMSLKHHAQ